MGVCVGLYRARIGSGKRVLPVYAYSDPIGDRKVQEEWDHADIFYRNPMRRRNYGMIRSSGAGGKSHDNSGDR